MAGNTGAFMRQREGVIIERITITQDLIIGVDNKRLVVQVGVLGVGDRGRGGDVVHLQVRVGVLLGNLG